MSNDNHENGIMSGVGLRCIEGCIYMVKGPVDPKTLKSKMMCRRMPPNISTFLVTDQHGRTGLGQATSYPEISSETLACGEFDDGSEDDDVIEGELIPGKGKH